MLGMAQTFRIFLTPNHSTKTLDIRSLGKCDAHHTYANITPYFL
jgi:hypothetical protein